jgi:predicted translin family RNA/ssDNA-binding protein
MIAIRNLESQIEKDKETDELRDSVIKFSKKSLKESKKSTICLQKLTDSFLSYNSNNNVDNNNSRSNNISYELKELKRSFDEMNNNNSKRLDKLENSVNDIILPTIIKIGNFLDKQNDNNNNN